MRVDCVCVCATIRMWWVVVGQIEVNSVVCNIDVTDKIVNRKLVSRIRYECGI